MAETREAEIAAQMEIVSRTVVDGKIALRGVATQDAVPAGARMVEDITLEEAYLAFMTGRGHHADDLEMADS